MIRNPEAYRKAKERIAKGIEFLDAHDETWRTRLDHKNLDIANPSCCVMGKLYGNYTEGCMHFDLAMYPPYQKLSATELGFERDLSRDANHLYSVTYADLQDAWAEALGNGVPTADVLMIEHELLLPYIPEESSDTHVSYC